MKTPLERILTDSMAHLSFTLDTMLIPHRAKFESPIEETLVSAIMCWRFMNFGDWPVVDGRVGKSDWHLTLQNQIGDYRIDLLLVDTNSNVKVAIECDGHDFHERTKEQAARDRKRDRDLQAKGYLVLRFTGSEIYRDPWRCADEIQQKIWLFDQARSD